MSKEEQKIDIENYYSKKEVKPNSGFTIIMLVCIIILTIVDTILIMDRYNSFFEDQLNQEIKYNLTNFEKGIEYYNNVIIEQAYKYGQVEIPYIINTTEGLQQQVLILQVKQE